MKAATTRFADRADAGRRLAQRLAGMGLESPAVYDLPRGGVPVAAEIARALRAPLDLVLVRKIGAPDAPEVALGAIVDGDDPQRTINEDVRDLSGADEGFVERAAQIALRELERRRALYLRGGRPVDPAGHTAIVVDDGIATGATATAAIGALRRKGAARICVAVPVAPAEVVRTLERTADDVVCLRIVEDFRGVGSYYDDFHQLTDREVLERLREARAPLREA
ncbi:phosphoribosyltransferase [Aureimonas sp. AU4]|uniref:phosphoribosyltransferase n=1 Tax=Aureimonas sp. AU4 TaxID=1638163 RepID=UPI000782C050|nr:phosphoribosyltransferase family protein [Aureimonas sp. AU4]